MENEKIGRNEEQIKLEKDTYEKLCEPFDLSCYSIDSSRGFDLTSLKAAYVFDRLNLVLGLTGWEFNGEFITVEGGGIVFHGRLVIKIGNELKVVTAVGASAKKKNPADSMKSAQTDSLSKCASYVGVAIDSFKGLVDPNDVKKSKGNSSFQPKKKAYVPNKATPKGPFVPNKEEPKKEVKKKSFIKAKPEDTEETW